MTTDRLLQLYRALRDRTALLPANLVPRLGCPFLICPRDKWRGATQRVVIIGQEPFEWGFEAGLHYDWPYPPIWSLEDFIVNDHSPEALMYAYRTHTYEIKSPYRATPFTRAFDYFRTALEGSNAGDVISVRLQHLWDSMSPCGTDRSPASSPRVRCIATARL